MFPDPRLVAAIVDASPSTRRSSKQALSPTVCARARTAGAADKTADGRPRIRPAPSSSESPAARPPVPGRCPPATGHRRDSHRPQPATVLVGAVRPAAMSAAYIASAHLTDRGPCRPLCRRRAEWRYAARKRGHSKVVSQLVVKISRRVGDSNRPVPRLTCGDSPTYRAGPQRPSRRESPSRIVCPGQTMFHASWWT